MFPLISPPPQVATSQPLLSPSSSSQPTLSPPQPTLSPTQSPLPVDPDFQPENLCVVLPLSPLNLHPMTTRSKNATSALTTSASATLLQPPVKENREYNVPTFDEYVRNGLATSTYGVIMAASFLGMEEVAGGEEFEWLKSNPKIIKAGKMIGRLRNDVVSHEDEQKRGDCASGVECYMKQYDVSEKKAIEEIQKMDVNVWKDINEDCMRPTNAPMLLLQHFVNLVRVTDVAYATDEDSYTIPLGLKDHVALLYIEQVPLYE
uniref:Terpene synthase metal-binding domain-containing protein n=1 Tax=Populus alba TaxID=43335 RepID=A0A4U5QLC0_POPAL|nr:hypothetical protein D5086_0000071850 [Populus alba]